METLKANNRSLEILLERLAEYKSRDPRFSLRAFAQRLELSSGALSEVLQGKRPLSDSIKKRIAPKLMLSPDETLEFFRNGDNTQSLGALAAPLNTSQDQFRLQAEWWHFGLYHLTRTRGFKNQTAWMARRLGLSVNRVNEAWQRLLRLGLLKETGKKVQLAMPSTESAESMRSLTMLKAHLNDLSLIENALHEVSPSLRENSACYFVIDKKDLPKARAFIEEFKNQFLQTIARESGDEVYKMSIALFPLTQVGESTTRPEN